MATFEHRTRVDISKVNSNGLITNKGLLSILEITACMHSDTAGFGILDIPNTHLSWVQLNWKVQIFRRLKYGENIIIKTWARTSSKVCTLRDFEVYDSNNNLTCIATTRWTLVNADTQTITKITDDSIDRYNPEEKAVFPNEYVYTTQRRDIDVNKHMHNLNYLDLAYETLPEEIYLNSHFNNIEIMYKSAIVLGDTVKCLYTKEGNKHIIVIKSIYGKKLHCIINLFH